MYWMINLHMKEIPNQVSPVNIRNTLKHWLTEGEKTHHKVQVF